jgi:hypothetical protein
VPNDVLEGMSGPKSWLASIALGLVGAAVGWLIFTAGLGIGDTDVSTWAGSSARSSAWSSCCWSPAQSCAEAVVATSRA